MKHLKKYKTFENTTPSGSTSVDIYNLSPMDRYNNENPAIELEENSDIINDTEKHNDHNYMALQNLTNIMNDAYEIKKKIEMGIDLDEWAKDHIATSADDIQEVLNAIRN